MHMARHSVHVQLSKHRTFTQSKYYALEQELKTD